MRHDLAERASTIRVARDADEDHEIVLQCRCTVPADERTLGIEEPLHPPTAEREFFWFWCEDSTDRIRVATAQAPPCEGGELLLVGKVTRDNYPSRDQWPAKLAKADDLEARAGSAGPDEARYRDAARALRAIVARDRWDGDRFVTTAVHVAPPGPRPEKPGLVDRVLGRE